MPHTFEACQQMLDEYRSYYSGNQVQIAEIDEFERDYNATNAIRWYTKSCFLFRLLNKALRTENIEILFTFRYFIIDLCANLEAIRGNENITRVYRGGQISKNEIENYSIGIRVAVNGFLSTSRDLSVALRFIGLESIIQRSSSQSRDDQIQFVLFEINIDKDSSSDVLWADISNQSAFPDEKEVLFDLGTIFEIVEINYDYEHYFWRIQMRPSTGIIYLKREYEDYICQRIKETNATVLFGILLTDMGEYEQATKYFQRLLRQMPDDHEDRPNVYYSVARIYRCTDQYEKALEYFLRAEQLQRDRLPESNFALARTLTGIGSVYYELNDYQQELQYYQQSMDLYQQILPENHIEIAQTFNRLGFAYANQQDYAKALDHLLKSLIIYNETVPYDHPGVSLLLYNMGVVYHALGYMDQSIDYYQKALKMCETILPNNHLRIAQSCYQMSVFYKEQHQYDLALQFAERTLSIYEKKLSEGHKLIRQVQDIIESLKDCWM
jgi:tetratricopeptide (TPR) repeat protein